MLDRLQTATSSECHVALQTTAGNRLFNVVVDNDATASRIVGLLNRDKCASDQLFACSWLQSAALCCLYRCPQTDLVGAVRQLVRQHQLCTLQSAPSGRRRSLSPRLGGAA